MDETPDLETVLDLLGDRTVREILVATSDDPVSANEIATRCDVDPSTVYRHVDELVDAKLLAEQTEIERDGSHHSVYEATLEGIDIQLVSEGFDGQVRVSQTPSERFTQIWNDVRGE